MSIDPVLSALLAGIVEGGDGDGSISLSVVTPGAIVSGSATSAADWQTRQIQDADAGGNEKAGGILHHVHASINEQLNSTKTNREDRNRVFGNYIHFVDATIFSGGQALRAGHIRIAADSVCGWTLISYTTTGT
ncbi:hypothetical protein [Arthrobacter sp. HLT1-21]